MKQLRISVLSKKQRCENDIMGMTLFWFVRCCWYMCVVTDRISMLNKEAKTKFQSLEGENFGQTQF